MTRTPLLLLIVAVSSLACTSPAPEVADPRGRATSIAQRLLISDGHVDLPCRLQASSGSRARLSTPDIDERLAAVVAGGFSGEFDLPRARAGGLDAAFLSISVPTRYEGSGRARALADDLIDLVERLAAAAPDRLALARTASEIRSNQQEGRISLLIGMENGSPLEHSLDTLRHFYERGVLYLTLAHAEDNHLADSSYDDHHTWGGLSPFGRDAVIEMNRLGMMVDISHLSDDAAHEVLDLSLAPVIASHSACRALTPEFERNMSDELLERLAINRGVIMINFGSEFLRPEIRRQHGALTEEVQIWAADHGLEASDERVRAFRDRLLSERPPGFADVTDVADHIDHAVRIAGIDHVGLGSNFDGVGDSLPTGLKDVSDYPNLIRVLLERGYSEPQIEKICAGNLLRVLEEVEELSRELYSGHRSPAREPAAE